MTKLLCYSRALLIAKIMASYSCYGTYPSNRPHNDVVNYSGPCIKYMLVAPKRDGIFETSGAMRQTQKNGRALIVGHRQTGPHL